MSARLDAAERLLALVIALSHTTHRMTKSQIRSGVAGYSDASSDEAFERMFERDKDTLRTLGIPLLTLSDSTHPDDVGYRIDTSAYALPPVDFTPAEVGVLSLAAQVWQDSSLAIQARRGLTKLRATASTSQHLQPATALRVRGPDAAFEALLEAIMARQAVRFDYRAANTGTSAVRTVEPWRLFARDRGWYLEGHDRDRQAARIYRLSRISGRVRPIGAPGQVQIPDDDGRSVGSTAPTQVHLAIRPGRGAALRARGTPGPQSPDHPDRDVLRVPTRDPELLAEQVAAYGEAVVVLDPPQVRQAVLRRLRAVAGLDQLPGLDPDEPGGEVDGAHRDESNGGDDG